ncbi:MAG: hypothetical protein HYR70_10620 [Chloroflexi bacterium]|nr:hypothetical protein [Chloroflexota bacterium]MBI3340337.1 hypothetical protein [Chloroflexota bacterium]
MDIILAIHSLVRWAIILVAAIAIIKFTISWAGNSSFKGMDRGLVSGYSGLIDLQVLLGLVYLIWNGLAGAGFPLYRIEHAIAMILAAFAGHLPARFKNLNDKLRFQFSLFAILGSLILVFIGLLFLPAH